MTLLRLDYQVCGLGNCVDDTSTKTGLRRESSSKNWQSSTKHMVHPKQQLSNTYGDAGRWTNVSGVRKEPQDENFERPSGSSGIVQLWNEEFLQFYL